MAKIACMVVLCMVVLIAPHTQALIPCVDVKLHIAACVPYLTSLVPLVPLGDCCSSLAAITILDRQTTCNCLKVEANIILGFIWEKAAALPTVCYNVNFPYPTSAQFDCSTV
ncbi:hypothetical protein MTR67_038019 [Solanum verrucosum]|uniref:Non-specific lipid-transfer protein n=1 Tax=Solanum verrucosum TaxID=315347 RepID=A0AAF0UEZ4_SOLVR|nr:hypothetical protein MTR67_038019 [Solanum verrucosum]